MLGPTPTSDVMPIPSVFRSLLAPLALTRLVFSANVPADASDRVLLDTMALVMTTADDVGAELTGADDW